MAPLAYVKCECVTRSIGLNPEIRVRSFLPADGAVDHFANPAIRMVTFMNEKVVGFFEIEATVLACEIPSDDERIFCGIDLPGSTKRIFRYHDILLSGILAAGRYRFM